MLELNIERVVGVIKEEGYELVAIQLPEGLKDKATAVVDEIKARTGIEVFIFGDPCYGACDLADIEAKALDCDALFHFGHTGILKKTAVPVHYIDVKISFDPIPLLAKNLKRLPGKLGIITTVQHISLLDEITSFLEEQGIGVGIGEAGGRAAHRGQVLGCSFTSAKKIADTVEGYLYIGTGDFHPLGVALSTGKKTLALDLERGELRDMDTAKERTLRRRFALIERSKDAVEFGIIIGEKTGQKRTSLAMKLKKIIEGQGKKAYPIILGEINPDVLVPFRRLDAFVNTACPRITIDDAGRYKKPLLTPVELEIVLGMRRWEDYEMDEIP